VLIIRKLIKNNIYIKYYYKKAAAVAIQAKGQHQLTHYSSVVL
jgi:hypothetical protein